ncbi:hypothetical protein HF086_005123 [Spodoptera exigua]|uniref:HAT C-terminal dimerisation domain-containing protein n=1 Tax=Spodoptera exigua TaxID=7107 RepID=A0A922MSU1_SPOEX|nr:hypothetical protein HF086_005123 [Spodoptera exigua]
MEDDQPQASTSKISEDRDDCSSVTTLTSMDSETARELCLSNSIKNAFERISSNKAGGTKYNRIVQALIFFICQDMRPFNIVEGEGFLRLVKELEPTFKVPGAKYLKKMTTEKYEACITICKSKLSKIDNFCLTLDIWTETMNEVGFMGVTIHFVENGQMCMYYLATRALRERHTAEYISENLLDILKKWNIPLTKIRAAVSDNASSMLAAIRMSLGEKKHLPCFAHTINLVVEEALKLPSVKSAVIKVREIVNWIKNSVVQSDKLRKIQMRNNVSAGSVLKLIADVRTRWNSTFFMLERFLKLRIVISEIVIESVVAPNLPSAVEMETLNELTTVLKPFEYVTRESSGQKYVTISKIIPMLNCLTTELNSITPNSAIVKECKDVLLRELKRRYGMIELNDHAAIATILDPRFKNLHFQDPSACGRAIQKLRTMVVGQLSSPSESEDDVSSTAPPEYDFWKHHKELAHGHKKKKKSHQGDEVSLYLSNPVVSLKSNPFAEWDDMKLVFPCLYKYAQQYLIVVATSVPSECLFSKAGATMTQTRNRLSSKYLEQLLFLGNLNAEEFLFKL